MGAFDDYQPPKGGAFGDYQPPGQPAASGPPPAAVAAQLANGATSAEDSPNWIPGYQTLHNVNRTFEDAFSMGTLDKLGGWLTGQDERAKTVAARQAIGPVASTAADALGYAMGPGKIIGAGLGAAGLGAKPVLGAMAEGGLAGAGGAAGHDQNIGTGAALGVGGGLLGAAAGGIVNKIATPLANAFGKVTGALSKPQDVVDSLSAAEKAAYKPLDSIEYHGADIGTNLQNTANDINAAGGSNALDRAKSVNAEITGLGNLTSASASDIQAAQARLRSIAAKSPRLEDQRFGNVFADGLDDLHQNVQPLAGGQAGDAAAILAQAKPLTGQRKNAEFLQDAAQGLKDFGASPAGDAQRIAQKFYEPGDPEYDALAKIAMAGGGSGITPWAMMHAAHPLLEAGAVGMAGHGLPATALTAAVANLGLKPGASAIMKAGQQRAVQGAITSAYPALTGMNTAYAPNVSPAMRALIFGRLAQGVGPAQ
jgi:hypothetical protein